MMTNEVVASTVKCELDKRTICVARLAEIIANCATVYSCSRPNMHTVEAPVRVASTCLHGVRVMVKVMSTL